MALSSPQLAFCLEQTFGHRTHGSNLEAALTRRGQAANVFRVEYGPRALLPWALAGSRSAWRQLQHSRGRHALTFFHTQTIALFARKATQGRPYVVSVDATPVQMDALGQWYRHGRSARPIEAAKRHWYRSVLRHADGVVAWSDWARQSLVDDYGVRAPDVLVAHPGAPDELFAIERIAGRNEGKPRVLFVGGDFERKGGAVLLEAFDRLGGKAELTVMTESEVPAQEGVRVVHGVRPGTRAFLDCFADADLFCLPTLGDCTPVALGEAMAAGLPVITTDVGSNRETIPEGTGVVVPANNVPALEDALRALSKDTEVRTEMGLAARRHALEHLSASRNADRVLDHLLKLAI